MINIRSVIQNQFLFKRVCPVHLFNSGDSKSFNFRWFAHSLCPGPKYLHVSMFRLTQSINSSNLALAWEPVELDGVLVLRVSGSLEPETG